MPFADVLRRTCGRGPALQLEGSAGSGASGTVGDLLALARELQQPARVAPETLAEATTVQFPGLDGVAAGLRPAGAERLGARLRAARRQVAALDGRRATRRRRSATSAAAARSSGSTRTPASRSAASPTSRSATGRPTRGRACRTRCWPSTARTAGQTQTGSNRCTSGSDMSRGLSPETCPIREQELEQQRVQLLRLVDADEVAGAGDDRRARRPGSPPRGAARSRGSRPCRSRRRPRASASAATRAARRLGPDHLGLLVRRLQLERPALLRAHLVVVLAARPRSRGSPASRRRGRRRRSPPPRRRSSRASPRSSPRPGTPAPTSTSRRTRAWCASAVRSATAPPNELPTRLPGRKPATTSTNEKGSVGSGVSPQPGRSGATTSNSGRERRAPAASRDESRRAPSG